MSLRAFKSEKSVQASLDRLFQKVSVETIEELKKRNALPNPSEVKSLLKALNDSKTEFGNILAEEAGGAVNAGRAMAVRDVKGKLAGLGIEMGRVAPMLPNPVVDRIKQKVFEASAGTMGRLVGRVMDNLGDSYAQGLGISEAAARLKDVFDSLRKFEAERIARTEINSAQNMGAEATLVELGIEYHQWWAASDDRVRETEDADHVIMHGQITKVGNYFDNGLLYPGDRSGGAVTIHEWINCRCRIVPYLMPEGMKAPPGKDTFYEHEIVKISEYTKPNVDSLRGQLPDRFVDKVSERLELADEQTKVVWNQYVDDIKIETYNNPGGQAFYSPGTKKITLTGADHTRVWDVKTFFHEAGHAIDDAAKSRHNNTVFAQNYSGNPTLAAQAKGKGIRSFAHDALDGAFPKALKADFDNTIDAIRSSHNILPKAKRGADGLLSVDDAMKYLETTIRSSADVKYSLGGYAKIDYTSGIHDIYEGLTLTKIKGLSGHGLDYWKKHNAFGQRLSTQLPKVIRPSTKFGDDFAGVMEGFAHFFQAKANYSTVGAFYEEHFPEAMEAFTKVMEYVKDLPK